MQNILTKQPAHVFISYSHDSDTHIRNVVDLANTLRTHGVDAQLDRFIVAPPEGWPRWVGRQIANADFIICVCTAQYRTSFEGNNDPEKGLGVNQEGFLIVQDLYEHGNRSERYIPITFGFGRGVIPASLRPFQSYDLPDEYEYLFRRVTLQPPVVPNKLVWPREPVPPAPRQAALENLPEQSVGFADQGEITEFLTPKQYPVEKLAPRDGLYLSRIINPQERTIHDLITTVWVTARGPLDYVIDSIRIRDYAWGGLGGNPVVSITPDAEYRFTYAEGSDHVHALNPALAIGPSTRHRASFTLGTAMEKGFYYVGELFIWVQYHTSDGTTGTLFLENTPADAWELAKLAGADIEFPIVYRGETDFGQIVITPEGLQVGFESQRPPQCRYIPVSANDHSLFNHDRDHLLRTRAKCLQTLQQRGPLHQALKHDTKREELKNWLKQGSLMAADLLGGMADEESTAILLEEFRNSHSDLALTGLCVRHIATGDELLARVAAESIPDDKLSTIISAMMLRPAGAWMDVLLRYQKHRAEAIPNILKQMEPELTQEDRSRILATPHGPLGCELFVRGTMNNWTTPANARLVYQGDGNYKATLSLDHGSYKFKIGGTEWRDGNFGGRQEGLRITAGEQVELFRSDLSHDLYLDLPGAAAADYTFTVDACSSAMPLLRISSR